MQGPVCLHGLGISPSLGDREQNPTVWQRGTKGRGMGTGWAPPQAPNYSRQGLKGSVQLRGHHSANECTTSTPCAPVPTSKCHLLRSASAQQCHGHAACSQGSQAPWEPGSQARLCPLFPSVDIPELFWELPAGQASQELCPLHRGCIISGGYFFPRQPTLFTPHLGARPGAEALCGQDLGVGAAWHSRHRTYLKAFVPPLDPVGSLPWHSAGPAEWHLMPVLGEGLVLQDPVPFSKCRTSSG